MNRTSPLARIALAGALALPAAVGVGASVASAATTTPVVYQLASVPERPVTNVGETFFQQTFSIDTADGVGRLAGSADGTAPFVVDDVITLHATHADGTTASYTHNFSNGCDGDVHPIPAIVLEKLLDPGSNLLTVTLNDACGVNEGTPDPLFLLVNKGNITPTTTPVVIPTGSTTPAGTGAPTVFLVKGPALTGVSWLGAPGKCVAQLSKTKGLSAVAAQACAYLAKAADPRPASSMTTKNLASLLSHKQFAGLLNLPSAEVVCQGPTAVASVLTSAALRSSGYQRASAASATKVKGEAFVDDHGIFDKAAPTRLVDAARTGVVVTFRTAFRLPALPNQYALTHTNAPFSYLVLQEKIGCDGSFVATATSSDVPGFVIYKAGVKVAAADQSTAYSTFAASGGKGHYTTGHGVLDTHCRIAVVAGSVKVPSKPTAAQCATAVTKGYLT